MVMLKRVYTIYDRRTEEVLAYGDKATCTKMLGLSPKNNFNSFFSLVKRANNPQKYHTNYEVLVETIDDDETP